MLIPFLKYQLIIAQAIEWDKLEIKTQRLKSENSGDWQKEKDQTPQKKREDLRKEGSKEKRFFIKSPQKNKEFKNKGFKIRNPLKKGV